MSILLGNGAGGFQPQRNTDAVASPDSLVTGKFVTGSPDADVAVLQNFSQGNGTSQLSILIGRGDGTFLPAVIHSTVFAQGAGPMVVGDFTGNGNEDIIVFSKNDAEGEIFLGNGDGTFQPGKVFATGENTFAAEAVDLNNNGILDLITAGTNGGSVYVQMGNGDGTFGPAIPYTVLKPGAGQNIGVLGLTVVGFQSTVSGSPAAEVTGTPGIYVTAQNRSGGGTGSLYFLPAQFDSQGHFTAFGAPQLQANLDQAGKLVAFDFNGRTDIVATDTGGVLVLYGVPLAQPGASGGSGLTIPSNTTPATARNLGGAANLLTQPEAIVSGFEDAYFTYQVPTEDVPGSGPEAIDFSALFQDVGGAGLGMEVFDAAGDVLGSGARFRVVAAQGSVLTIHVFGEPANTADGLAQGSGIYTLDIDVLPQVVSVHALSPIPGGPVTSIVLTFQGDSLDPAAAENPENYTVIYLGPGPSTVVPIAATAGGQPIIYNPGLNVDVTSGLTYATAVDQTVTLFFAQALPPGSYQIELSRSIQAAAFNAAEAGDLATGDDSFAGHPVVSVNGCARRRRRQPLRAGPGGRPSGLGHAEVGGRRLALPDPTAGRPRVGARRGDPGRPRRLGHHEGREQRRPGELPPAVRGHEFRIVEAGHPVVRDPLARPGVDRPPVALGREPLVQPVEQRAVQRARLGLRIGRLERRDDRHGERRGDIQSGCGQRRGHGARRLPGSLLQRLLGGGVHRAVAGRGDRLRAVPGRELQRYFVSRFPGEHRELDRGAPSGEGGAAAASEGGATAAAASATASNEGGASASSSAVLAAHEGASVSASLAGALNFEEGTSTSSTESSGATASAAATGGTTGVGQPTKTLLFSVSGESDQDMLSEEESANGVPSFVSILKAAKKALSSFSGVIDALGASRRRRYSDGSAASSTC